MVEIDTAYFAAQEITRISRALLLEYFLVFVIRLFHRLFYDQAAVETAARLETEDPVQLQVADQLIDGCLAMFAGNLGQDQLGGVTVVKTAEIGLHLEQFPCPVECHPLSPFRVAILAARGVLRKGKDFIA
jgi:hypothetical protein